jgi:hypothetical protein
MSGFQRSASKEGRPAASTFSPSQGTGVDQEDASSFSGKVVAGFTPQRRRTSKRTRDQPDIRHGSTQEPGKNLPRTGRIGWQNVGLNETLDLARSDVSTAQSAVPGKQVRKYVKLKRKLNVLSAWNVEKRGTALCPSGRCEPCPLPRT